LEDYRTYRLGDTLDWGDGKGLRFPSQRPSGGNYTGDGYIECPDCKKDYWVTITVEADVIVSAVVNPAKPGYIT
jgi:hypothetical protein